MGKSSTGDQNQQVEQPSKTALAEPQTPEANQEAELMQQGIQLHQSGQLPEAEIIYRRILNASPNHADANHLLGVIAYQVGNYDVAEKLISQAIQGPRATPVLSQSWKCSAGYRSPPGRHHQL